MSPITENQMEKNMEIQVDTGTCRDLGFQRGWVLEFYGLQRLGVRV